MADENDWNSGVNHVNSGHGSWELKPGTSAFAGAQAKEWANWNAQNFGKPSPPLFPDSSPSSTPSSTAPSYTAPSYTSPSYNAGAHVASGHVSPGAWSDTDHEWRASRWRSLGKAVVAFLVIGVLAVGAVAVSQENVQRPAANGAYAVGSMVAVATTNLNLRAGPLRTSHSVVILPENTVARVTGEEQDGWTPVEVTDGAGKVYDGFLRSHLLKPAD